MAKAEKGRQVSKVERTGDNDVVIHHENGDTFEGLVDKKKMRFKEDAWGNKYFFGGIDLTRTAKRGNVMSNADRRKVGISEDPSLPDYKGTNDNNGELAQP